VLFLSEDVRFLGELDAKLIDGDSISVLTAVAGGALGFVAAAALLARPTTPPSPLTGLKAN
jgi:hypothetical protein